MKKVWSLFMMGVFLSLFVISPIQAEEASQIVEKMIEASGGRKLLESIQDTTLTGDMELTQQGLSGTVTFYHKEPDKMRQDIEIMGMLITNATDGEIVWAINPQTGGVEEQHEERGSYFKKVAFQFGNSIILHPEKYGVTYSSKGKEKIENKEYLVIEQKFSDGYSTTMYVDSDTHLVYKTRQKSLGDFGNEIDQESIFEDYREVDGIMMPHMMTIFRGGEEFGGFAVTELKLNSGLEDSLFQMEK